MAHKTNRKVFFALVFDFLDSEIPARRFVPRFMRLWKKQRDEQWALKSTWSEPFDEQLQAGFLARTISGEEFSKRWHELWGHRTEHDVRFQEFLDTTFTACDVYRDDPRDRREDFGYDEDQLRSSVAESLSSYFQAVTKGNKVTSR